MWSHTDRAPSSQISRSTAHGAHKRPGHNWKCQNQYCWQALIKLNMFPSGEGRGRGGGGVVWRGGEAGTGGSNELAVWVQWLWGHLWLCMWLWHHPGECFCWAPRVQSGKVTRSGTTLQISCDLTVRPNWGGSLQELHEVFIAYFDAALAMHSCTGVAQEFWYNLCNNT